MQVRISSQARFRLPAGWVRARERELVARALGGLVLLFLLYKLCA